MRSYFLVSPYLSDTQRGIQSIHTRDVQIDQHGKFEGFSPDTDLVMLSYGFDNRIVGWIEKFLSGQPAYYLGVFKEPQLNNTKTIGFIAPDDLCFHIDMSRREKDSKFFVTNMLRDGVPVPEYTGHKMFVDTIASFSLA